MNAARRAIHEETRAAFDRGCVSTLGLEDHREALVDADAALDDATLERDRARAAPGALVLSSSELPRRPLARRGLVRFAALRVPAPLAAAAADAARAISRALPDGACVHLDVGDGPLLRPLFYTARDDAAVGAAAPPRRRGGGGGGDDEAAVWADVARKFARCPRRKSLQSVLAIEYDAVALGMPRMRQVGQAEALFALQARALLLR